MNKVKTELNYKKMRDKFRPAKIKLVFILESPPKSWKYFYDEKGDITEPLFKAMMRLLGFNSPLNKKEGLEKFKQRGYLIVDSTYKPVNHLKNKERNKIIKNNFDNLLKDLKKLKSKRLLLVKKNICKLLSEKLSENEYNVINFLGDKFITVPFPCCGWQNKFHDKTTKLIHNS